MTENKVHNLLFDGDCPLCLRIVRRTRDLLEKRGFALVPLQTDWVRTRLDLPEEELLKEMHLLTVDDRVLRAVDAYVFIWRKIWWCFPLRILAHVPGVRFLMDALYRWVARNRMCLSGDCSLPRQPPSKKGPGILGWLPLLALPGLTIAFQNHFPEKWIFMWVLAFAIYFGCKWLTLSRTWANGLRGGPARSLGYLFLWPGMDAKPFMDDTEPAEKPAWGEWLGAWFKFLLGTFILWGLTPLAGESSPILSAWTGMLGVILMLHFGSFHLMSLAWRSFGVVAEPIMRSPVMSTSLSLFWSERWNRGFNQLAHDLVFRVTYRRFGVGTAILLVFLVSGLVHDLVISLPAGAMFGLPTAYFMIQGVGVLIERSRHGRRRGLKGGAMGWVFMCIFTVGPAYWLLHEPFLLNVILPFLKAIKAL
jgi:predicted DCC family thiol-disulfide oxidoreductase YuxK